MMANPAKSGHQFHGRNSFTITGPCSQDVFGFKEAAMARMDASDGNIATTMHRRTPGVGGQALLAASQFTEGAVSYDPVMAVWWGRAWAAPAAMALSWPGRLKRRPSNGANTHLREYSSARRAMRPASPRSASVAMAAPATATFVTSHGGHGGLPARCDHHHHQPRLERSIRQAIIRPAFLRRRSAVQAETAAVALRSTRLNPAAAAAAAER